MKRIILCITMMMIGMVYAGELSNREVVYVPFELRVENNNMDYLFKMRMRESSGRYDAIGVYGHLGAYQFSQATLRGLGLNVSREQFLQDTVMQDEAMMLLLKHNLELLGDRVFEYCGKEINGEIITTSGILAGAHLLGYRGIMNYLTKGINGTDGLGTPIGEYVREFSGYNLEI